LGENRNSYPNKARHNKKKIRGGRQERGDLKINVQRMG